MEKGKRKAENETDKVVCTKKQKREEGAEHMDVKKKKEAEEEEADASSSSSFDGDDDVLKFPLLISSNVGEPSGKIAQKPSQAPTILPPVQINFITGYTEPSFPNA